ncbi:hypothetical protein HK101_001901 [Irineochytrium annulatum]|nr:hypothetical protein HK101_001901 [Irineochytrium annulatum]
MPSRGEEDATATGKRRGRDSPDPSFERRDEPDEDRETAGDAARKRLAEQKPVAAAAVPAARPKRTLIRKPAAKTQPVNLVVSCSASTAAAAEPQGRACSASPTAGGLSFSHNVQQSAIYQQQHLTPSQQHQQPKAASTGAFLSQEQNIQHQLQFVQQHHQQHHVPLEGSTGSDEWARSNFCEVSTTPQPVFGSVLTARVTDEFPDAPSSPISEASSPENNLQSSQQSQHHDLATDGTSDATQSIPNSFLGSTSSLQSLSSLDSSFAAAPPDSHFGGSPVSEATLTFLAKQFNDKVETPLFQQAQQKEVEPQSQYIQQQLMGTNDRVQRYLDSEAQLLLAGSVTPSVPHFDHALAASDIQQQCVIDSNTTPSRNSYGHFTPSHSLSSRTDSSSFDSDSDSDLDDPMDQPSFIPSFLTDIFRTGGQNHPKRTIWDDPPSRPPSPPSRGRLAFDELTPDDYGYEAPQGITDELKWATSGDELPPVATLEEVLRCTPRSRKTRYVLGVKEVGDVVADITENEDFTMAEDIGTKDAEVVVAKAVRKKEDGGPVRVKTLMDRRPAYVLWDDRVKALEPIKEVKKARMSIGPLYILLIE